MPRVMNKRTDHVGRNAVYVGRPSKWGNPFVIDRDGTREEVLSKYRDWVMKNPEMIRAARSELVGRDLVCWCAPEPCHADLLLEIANRWWYECVDGRHDECPGGFLGPDDDKDPSKPVDCTCPHHDLQA